MRGARRAALAAGALGALFALPAQCADGGALPERSAPVPEPAGYWSGPIHSPVPAAIAGGTVIETAALRQLLQTSGLVLLDASDAPHRPAQLAPDSAWLPAAHQAIPGSRWLPGAGLAVLSAQADAYLRRRLAELTAGDMNRTVVVYCHERCWLSWNAARRAINYGYRDVRWFPAGIEGWLAQDGPTAPVDAEALP